MTLAVGRLTATGSGRSLGSVFAVTRYLALTSLHSLRRESEHSVATLRVRCMWQSEASDATVQAWDEQIDVAVLRLSRPLPESLDPVPLTGDTASHDRFVALGAPDALSELHLAAVNGLVILPDAQMPDGSPGIELFCFPAAVGMSLHGLSGAPVLTGSPERAIGLIRWNPQRVDEPGLAEGGIVYAAPARRILEIWPELSPTTDVPELVQRLVDRHRARDPAGVYLHVRTLLTDGLQLDESDIQVLPALHGGRSWIVSIDIKQAVISVDRDLSDAAFLAVAERKLTHSVKERSEYADQHYIAILTDGVTWRLYHIPHRELELVDTETTDPRIPGKLLEWLGAVLATGRNIPPDQSLIETQLGAASPSYKLAAAELTAIYKAHCSMSTVQIKRRMWAKLLTTASGISFADDDLLFIDHSLLVATAKVIGHAVLGFQLDDPEVSATAVMSGALFTEAKINGVIEADFFDWISEVPGGDEFVVNLARRLSASTGAR